MTNQQTDEMFVWVHNIINHCFIGPANISCRNRYPFDSQFIFDFITFHLFFFEWRKLKVNSWKGTRQPECFLVYVGVSMWKANDRMLIELQKMKVDKAWGLIAQSDLVVSSMNEGYISGLLFSPKPGCKQQKYPSGNSSCYVIWAFCFKNNNKIGLYQSAVSHSIFICYAIHIKHHVLPNEIHLERKNKCISQLSMVMWWCFLITLTVEFLLLSFSIFHWIQIISFHVAPLFRASSFNIQAMICNGCWMHATLHSLIRMQCAVSVSQLTTMFKRDDKTLRRFQ